MIDRADSQRAAHPRRGAIRRMVLAGLFAALAGCAVVPKPVTPPPPPPRAPETAPQANVLPTDTDRHRIALLVPTSGAGAALGQAIANATTMALLDTNAQSLRITTYDTATGAAAAATRAIADGNRLILGPVNAEDVPAVVAVARPAKVPLISYTNDADLASRDVFVFGEVPGQAVARVIGYARAHGVTALGAVVPTGSYGDRVIAALNGASRTTGVRVTGIESYERTNTSVGSAVRRIKARGQADAILIADNARIAAYAAPFASGLRVLGTELWAGESGVAHSKALQGAWFAAVPDAGFARFEAAYRERFGASPPRRATMGYDSVLLVLSIARNWKDGPFPTARLFASDGFIGRDGLFRFNEFGIAERAMEVREVGAGTFVTVSPAPAHFTKP